MPNRPPDIVDTRNLGVPVPPGGAGYAIPAVGPRPYDLRADPTAQYVAGGYFAPLGDYIRTLPEWIDPIQRDFGLDTYQRMVDGDAQVGSCIDVYKANVLSDGWRFAPAQDTDEPAPRRPGQRARKKSSDQAQEVCDFVQHAVGAMDATPFPLVLRQMLDAMHEGHKVAEKVLRVEATGRWAGRLVFDRIKPRPPRCTAFVQDAYDNLVGILGLMPNVPFYGMWPSFGFLAGSGLSLLPGTGRDTLQRDAPSLLPRSKFCVLTWDGQDGSPLGRSVLRRAFTPWWWKENGYALWGQLVSQHASPTIIGETGPDAMDTPDPTGALDANGHPVMLAPQEALGRALAAVQSGSYIALPPGAKAAGLVVNSSGEAIAKFMDWNDRQIAKAILGQTLSTDEGKSGTRAQGQVHEATKDDVTRYGRVALTQMVLTDIVKLIVSVNGFPPELTPEFGLGQEETMSFADFCQGASQIGYKADDSQFVGLDEIGGVPPRDPAAWDRQMQMRRQQQEQAATIGDKAAEQTPGDKGAEGQAVIQKAKP